MSIRLALLTATVAVTLVSAIGPSLNTATAADAKFVRCMTAPLSVSETGHGIWGVNRRLTALAIADWQVAASREISPYYGSWSNALGSTIDCRRDLFKVVCVVTATPCRS